MRSQYTCPCCSESLLVHIRGQKKVGFCLKCYQEMPLIEQYSITENKSILNPRDDSNDFIEILLKNKQNLNHFFQDSAYGLWMINRELRTLLTNQKLSDILGYKTEDIQGKSFCNFLDQHEPIVDVLSSPQSLTLSKQYELKLLHQKGHEVWVKLSLIPLIDEDHQCQAYLLRLVDLTDFKQSRERLQQQTQREAAINHILQVMRTSAQLTTIFEAAVYEIGQILPVVSVQVFKYLPRQNCWMNQAEYCPDYQTHQSHWTGVESFSTGTVQVMCQDRLKLPLHISNHGIQPSNLTIDGDKIQTFLQSCPGTWLPIPLYYQSSIWGCLSFVMQDPQYHWLEQDHLFVQSLANQLSIAIDQAELYQQLEQARQKLQTLSALDQLTQLPNRYHFNQNLQQSWQQLSTENRYLSLILCYVDCFSHYQVTYGDRKANEWLKQIAFLIRSHLNHPDQLVARYAHAEFALLLPNTEPAQAINLINTLQIEIEKLNISSRNSPQSLNPTVSFGMASLIPQLGLSPQRLLMTAEQALDQGASPFCKCLLPQW